MFTDGYEKYKASIKSRKAVCRFEGAGTGSVEGRVEISQANTTSPAVFRVEVRGLGSSAKHGLHVHEHGDTGDNCGAAGGHFNPLHVSSE